MATYPHIVGEQERPASVHAEMTILGAMLVEPVAIIDATMLLKTDDFALDIEGIVRSYRQDPSKAVNPEADYADQSDLYRVQKEAVAKGVKHLFIVWFDGMDWDTTRAAAIAKSGNPR